MEFNSALKHNPDSADYQIRLSNQTVDYSPAWGAFHYTPMPVRNEPFAAHALLIVHPTTAELQVVLHRLSDPVERISITDPIVRKVYETTVNTKAGLVQINIGKVNPGLYLISGHTQNGKVISNRIIKK